MNRGRFTRSVVVAGVAAALMLSGGNAAYATSAGPGDPAPAPTEEAEPLTPGEIAEQLTEVEDPASREIAKDVLDELADTGAEIYDFSVTPYEPVGGEVSSRALPAGCSLISTASRVGNQIRNVATSRCTSGNWATAQHQQKIVATDPFSFYQWTVTNKSASTGSGFSWTTTAAFTCANTNLTSWSINTKGWLNKGGVNYETPLVTDMLSSVQSCGR